MTVEAVEAFESLEAGTSSFFTIDLSTRHRCDDIASPITLCQALRFSGETSRIKRLGIIVGTKDGQAAGRILLRLRDAGSRLQLAQAEYDVVQCADNQPIFLYVPMNVELTSVYLEIGCKPEFGIEFCSIYLASYVGGDHFFNGDDSISVTGTAIEVVVDYEDDGGYCYTDLYQPRYVVTASDFAAESARLFDKSWYYSVASVPDGYDAVDHYLDIGQFEDLSPTPLFDPTHYRGQVSEIAPYSSAFAHYLRVGSATGLSPHPLFDPIWYAAQALALDPIQRDVGLGHYVQVGDGLGLSPHPLFDAAWFRKVYGQGELEGCCTLAFFLKAPLYMCLDPHPLFSTHYYYHENKDVYQSQLIPVIHYILYGAKESRECSKIFIGSHCKEYSSPKIQASERNLLAYLQSPDVVGYAVHPLFDEPWYRDRWQLPKDQKGLLHYLRYRDGRACHPEYSKSKQFERLLVRAEVPRLPSTNIQKVHIIHVNHSLGGGTQHYVHEIIKHLDSNVVGISLRYEPRGSIVTIELDKHHRMFDLNSKDDSDAMLGWFRSINVAFIHYHQVLGAPDILRNLHDVLDRPYVVTVHDFYWICPRVTMVDASGSFCGGASPEKCSRCVSLCGSYPGLEDEYRQFGTGWLGRSRHYLGRAAKVIAPSQDTARHILASLGLVVDVQPHPYKFGEIRPLAPVSNGRLRVLVLGGISEIKGSKRLLELTRAAQIRYPDMEFVLVGHAENGGELTSLANVIWLGSYDNDNVSDIIAAVRPHCAVFLHVWPETYSYTLSEVVRAGVYPISSDIGACAERIREAGWGTVFPSSVSGGVISKIIREAVQERPLPDRGAYRDAVYEPFVAAYYGETLAHLR